MFFKILLFAFVPLLKKLANRRNKHTKNDEDKDNHFYCFHH